MCVSVRVCVGEQCGGHCGAVFSKSFFFFVRSASVAVVVAVLTLSGKGLRFRVRAYVFHVRGLFSFLLIFQALITHRVAL